MSSVSGTAVEDYELAFPTPNDSDADFPAPEPLTTIPRSALRLTRESGIGMNQVLVKPIGQGEVAGEMTFDIVGYNKAPNGKYSGVVLYRGTAGLGEVVYESVSPGGTFTYAAVISTLIGEEGVDCALKGTPEEGPVAVLLDALGCEFVVGRTKIGDDCDYANLLMRGL